MMRLGIRSWLPLALVMVAPAVASAQIEEPRIPLQTKLSELNRFRTEYAENHNKHDAAAVAAMYSSDAILIAENGAQVGGPAIAGFIADGIKMYPHVIIQSDSMAIYGNTAVDVGKFTGHTASGEEHVQSYLVVMRRDMNGWKLVRVSGTPITN